MISYSKIDSKQKNNTWINRIFLWSTALSAPCAIIYARIPFTITPIRCIAVLSGFFVLTSYLRQGVIRLSLGEFIFFLIALLLSAISLFQSTIYFDQAFFFFLSVVLFILVYITTAYYARDSSWNSEQLMGLLIITGVIFSVIGIADWIYGNLNGLSLWKAVLNYPDDTNYPASIVINSTPIPRATGLFSDPNLYAYYLLLPTSLVFMRLLCRSYNQKYSRVGMMLIFLIFLTALMLSMSRSGIAVLFGCILFLVQKRFRAYAIVLIPIAITVLVLSVSLLDQDGTLLEIMSQRLGLHRDVTATVGVERSLRFFSGIEAFLSSPLYGVGFGDLGHFLPENLNSKEVVTSHNFYLDILASMGIIGFSALALATIIFLFNAWLNTKHSAIARAAVIAACGIFVTQLVYRNLLSPALAFQLSIVATLCRKPPPHS